MARSIAQALNLIRTTTAPSTASRRDAVRLVACRCESTQPDRHVASDTSEAEAVAVQRIEDAIHRIIVRRSAPDWLPFCPGASYWVPPRRSSYGVADLVHKLSNTLSEEETMSLATFRGWPSSTFYLNNENAVTENDSMSKKVNQSDKEEN
ncbi:PREDICTED: uncharacterized protein LOC109227351 [Nicotiana attenuata]|uniref:Uncharacterized protein n=1 Tax=Nicotiana attenuata TaxID=49451 RepID=A0A1J6ICD6_NICAT|nr:PREDICTED: uncharacterized protein LOC109227351 [Nicotiana attenuata]OIT02709.1 hypothetical protein A4A49_12154 [Nicotiana attenuata]